MLLKLYYYGNPILRKKCRPVEKITNSVRELIANMIETMDANRGCGLAANQVGILSQIFVIRPMEIGADGEYVLGQPEIFINPSLSQPSKETETMEEGCLSVPGIHEQVERPFSIHMKAIDINEKEIELYLEGFKARVIMHETDHLKGVFFIDRLESKGRKEIEPLLREIKKKYSST